MASIAASIQDPELRRLVVQAEEAIAKMPKANFYIDGKYQYSVTLGPWFCSKPSDYLDALQSSAESKGMYCHRENSGYLYMLLDGNAIEEVEII